jgi:hypothetical protein
MLPADVTAITTAFSPADLLDTFIAFAPFILTVIGIGIGVGLVKWGIGKIKGMLHKGV